LIPGGWAKTTDQGRRSYLQKTLAKSGGAANWKQKIGGRVDKTNTSTSDGALTTKPRPECKVRVTVDMY